MADSFQPRFVDLVRNYTDTTGTQNLVLGSAVPGYQGFADSLKTGEGFYYSIIAVESAQTEVGRGMLQADGTISREPVNGTLTDFGPGTKSVALVAGAEWFEGVQAGSAGMLGAAASRDQLAAADTGKPAILHEGGRTGLFLFEAGDKSAEVAADAQQGIHVAPLADRSGATGAWVRQSPGPVEARWFGTVGDGIADDTAALQAAINYLETVGGSVLRLGSGTFVISDYLSLIGLTLDARGATVTSAMTVTNTMFYLGADARVLGGTWILTGGTDAPYFFEVDSTNSEIDGAQLVKEPEAGGYNGYLRASTDGFVMRNCRTKGSNGIYCEGTNCAFLSNAFVGRAAGGDDAIAIKAISGSASNIRIIGNSFENLAYFCSIGSEIGMLEADDPSRSRGVYNVVVAGNCGIACSGLLFVKPGAISNYDFRDGTVEGVVISDNVLRDITGAKFTRGIAITAARGARVRNITGKNNVIIARTLNEGGRHVGALDVYVPDMSAMSTAGPPSISDIDVAVEFSDPFDGVLAGVGGATGLPTSNIAAIELQTPTFGTIRNVTVDIKGNGCQQSGIAIQGGLDDAVTIRRAILTNVATDGSAVFGGIQYKSRIKLGSEISITMAAGSGAKAYKPIAAGTAGIISPTETLFLATSIPAGTDSAGRIVRWAAPRNCFVHKVEIVSSTAIAKSADDTNYTQHEVRNENGFSVPNSVSSKATGGTALPAALFNTIYDSTGLTSSAFNDCFYNRGHRLSYVKNDFGAGNALTDASLRVHWAPF